jgi:long-chain acyl-CoA synthetase
MSETLQQLVKSLGKKDAKTALLALDRTASRSWSYRELAERAEAFAHGLVKAGCQAGDNIALFAANSPEWIASALGVLRAGAVVMPLDVQLGDEDLAHILADSATRAVVTTERRVARLDQLAPNLQLILLDVPPNDARSWERFCLDEPVELAVVEANNPAVLFYTSGTTGPPKGVPLTHANIASQLPGVRQLRIVTDADRVLLPLPLHHVYPFVIGMLTPLSLGLPIILPFSLTGQQLLRALREGDVTAIIGVPRLYSALYDGIRSKVESSGRIARRLFAILLRTSAFLRQSLGVRAGKILFRSLHRRFGKNLRILASGGSALEPDLATNLESLGWQIAIGYGLTETSPLLSVNLPADFRRGSAGKIFPGVELRIDPTVLEAETQGDGRGMGEVLARGPNVFAGYRNLPEQTAHAFTADGWFRTGDIGYFEDGFLFIAGRLSTLIKTESGEKVQTEDVESAYAKEPALREIGILEKQGKLVALIVPERAACGDDIESGVRAALEKASRQLPSYERISDFALTNDALPRTRLGKLQRHRLLQRFAQAKTTGDQTAPCGVMPLEEMSGEDRALFEEPGPNAVWQLLVRRYPDKRLTPDTSLQFDLGVDSLEWLNLTLEIAETSGVEVTEEAIARVDTMRDLLREVLEAAEGGGIDPLAQPHAILDERQKRWLRPLGPLMNLAARTIYAFGRVLMRLLFRVRVIGRENLPNDRPWIMTPNHISYLDGFVLANVLDWEQLRQTYWAGWTGIVAANAFMRFLSRLGRILPVEPSRAARTGLAFGAIVLQDRKNLVWFPEGGLSRSGQLQEFKPGIGLLLERFPTAVVPVCIKGTSDALPPDSGRLRFRPVRIVIGKPCSVEELRDLGQGQGEKPPEQIANGLRVKVAELQRQSL